MTIPTVQAAIDEWLSAIKESKSPRTYITYKSSMQTFLRSMSKILKPSAPASQLSDRHFSTLVTYLKDGSPGTERHHSTVVTLFFEFLSAKGYVHQPNLMDAIRYTRRNQTRRMPKRMRQIDFPSVAEVVHEASKIDVKQNVILARAKAIVLLLAESGLRGAEPTKIRTQDLDTKEMMGVVIGKGDKQAPFIFGADALAAIEKYHSLRKEKTEWLFISHSKRDAKVIRPIEYDTIRRDVETICNLILTHSPKFKITPHQFRHYLVTTVWRDTGDIEAARLVARHNTIATTQGYIHDDVADLKNLLGKMKK